jgi:quercetin dioxygenase-like cupin family protein
MHDTNRARPPKERPDIAQAFNYTQFDPAAFHARGLREFMQYRDLGLRAASGGLMRAEHIRRTGGMDAKTGWHCHDLDFQFVFVLGGQVHFVTQDGQTVTLCAGDCAHLPGLYRHDEIEFSPDFEVLEITAPADVTTIVGRDAALPVHTPVPGRISEFALSYERPQAYKVGDGPRRFLAYRDAAATAATGRRVNINVVRNSQAGDSSTGWHYHTLSCQFLYVLKGWARVEIEGQGEYTVRSGDAMTIPGRLKHDVTGFSDDFTVLELNIPADYDTVACEAPGRLAASAHG